MSDSLLEVFFTLPKGDKANGNLHYPNGSKHSGSLHPFLALWPIQHQHLAQRKTWNQPLEKIVLIVRRKAKYVKDIDKALFA